MAFYTAYAYGADIQAILRVPAFEASHFKESMIMFKSRSVVLHLVCCGVLLMAGCGESEPSQEAGEDAAAQRSSNDVTAQIRSRVSGEFPDDLPLYPGLNDADVNELGDGFEVNGVSDDSVETIHAYITETLGDNDWVIHENLSDTSSAEFRIYHYVKGDRAVTVVVYPEGPQTKVETKYQSEPAY